MLDVAFDHRELALVPVALLVPAARRAHRVITGSVAAREDIAAAIRLANPITPDGMFGIFLGHTFIVTADGHECVDDFPLEIAVAPC